MTLLLIPIAIIAAACITAIITSARTLRREFLEELSPGDLVRVYLYSYMEEGWFYAFVAGPPVKGIVRLRWNVTFTGEREQLIAAGWLIPTRVGLKRVHRLRRADYDYLHESFIAAADRTSLAYINIQAATETV